MNQKQVNDLLCTMDDLLKELNEVQEKSKQVDHQCKSLEIRASDMKEDIHELEQGLQSLGSQYKLVTPIDKTHCLMGGNEL